MTGSTGPATVPEVWRTAVAAHGDRLVLTDHLGPVTYRELDELVSRSAAALAAVARPGSWVLLPNGWELCAVLLGAWSAGLTAVPAVLELVIDGVFVAVESSVAIFTRSRNAVPRTSSQSA